MSTIMASWSLLSGRAGSRGAEGFHRDEVVCVEVLVRAADGVDEVQG